ncbi:MAG: ISKra4 family transposase [Nitrospiraceae bacterium]
MAALAFARPQLPAAAAYLSATEKFNQLRAQLQALQTQQMSHSELENLIQRDGREVLRLLYQAHLDERAPGTADTAVVNADGDALTDRRTQTRPLESVFGPVTVTRTGYGGPGLSSLHPLDAALNLPDELYSHTVRRCAAEAAAQQSYDEVGRRLAEQTGAHVPKRQIEQLAERAAQDFEPFYEQRCATAATAAAVGATGAVLVISTDGKGVPLSRTDLRPVTRQAAEARQPRLEHRRSKGEKPHTKRISTVAAVYTTAPFVRTPEQVAGELRPHQQALPVNRPRPEDKRVWASLEQAPAEIIRQAFEEAEQRDPQHTKHWCALVDGHRAQLAAVKSVAADYGVELTIVLDLIHVTEYLWDAAWALHTEGDAQAEAWVSERLLEILRGRSSQVAAGMRRSATLRGLSAKTRRPLDKCADYLLKYRAYLRYDQYLEAGLPIATGVIEGACRYLVKDRMELTGARWRLRGAEAVLRLRSLRASGDFDEYWDYHLQQEYARTHAARYAEGVVPLPPPPTPQPQKSHLRLVK